MALYTIIVYIPVKAMSSKQGWHLIGNDDSDERFCKDYIWKTPGPANNKAKTWNEMFNKEGYFYEVIEL